MAQVVLLGGILLALYGVAVLAGGRVAASTRMRGHSRRYGLVACAVGVVVTIVGAALLAGGAS